MSIVVLSRPIVSGCNWNAAGNPIVYKFQRQDAFANQCNNNAGNLQLQMNGIDVTSLFTAGNSIYFSGYGIHCSVTSASFSGGNTLINTDAAFISSVVGYIVNNSIRTDYCVEVEAFRSSDNTSLTDGVKLTFSPSRTGIMMGDVSAIVKNFLSAEWSLPAGDNEADEEASLKFYIKYQEYFDGAVQGSLTSDSANPLISVFGAMQVGSTNGGNMLDYFTGEDTKLWLTKFQLSEALNKAVLWRDWPFTISFIWPTPLGLSRIIKQYNAANVEISSTTQALTSSTDNIHRMKVGSIDVNAKRFTVQLSDTVDLVNNTFTGSISPWANQGSSSNSWAYGSDDVVGSFGISGSDTKYLMQSLVSIIPSGFVIEGEIDIDPNVGTADVDIVIWDGSTYQVVDTIPVVNGALQTYAFSGVASINGTHFGFTATRTDGLTSPTSVRVSRVAFEVNNSISLLDIEVRDSCDYDADLVPVEGRNPIHLFWKNSLGGDAFWNFQLFHEYTYTYNNGRKAKRIILFETDLHPVQWEALNELNTVGEVYSPTIQELTSSVNATSKRVGQQVYIISQDGTKKTGVLVIPSTDKVFARDSAYRISIEIELPEVFSI